jgi:UDP-glucose 4-epimerase
VAALAHLGEGGENLALNCGYGLGYSVREVLDAVERITGQDLDIRSAPRRAGDPPELVAAVSRITDTLGWRPQHDDLDGIVRSAIDWERKLAQAG